MPNCYNRYLSHSLKVYVNIGTVNSLPATEYAMQRSIPCLFMRGGTSRGPFFLDRDLPADVAQRDALLLAVMGSPDVRQIDGMGGADPLTSTWCM